MRSRVTLDKTMPDKGHILIYQTPDGQTELDVRLEQDSVWLSQAQIADLFQRDRTVIGRHIARIYKEGELEEGITCAFFAHMGSEQDQSYETRLYNLDVIISVGYRVRSLRGTQFRIWANRVLKEYLIKGYAINRQIYVEQLEDLKRTISIMSDVMSNKQINKSEAVGLLKVIRDFSYGLDTLIATIINA